MNRSTFSFVLMIVGVVVYIFFFTKEWSSLKSARADNQAANYAISELTNIQKRSDELRDIYNRIDPVNLAKVSAMVPKGPETADFVSSLDAMASRNGVILRQLNFGASPIRREQTPGAVPADLNVRTGVFSLTATFDVIGEYSNFRKFLSDLELNQRLTDVTSINFGSAESSAQLPTYTIEVKIYYQ